MTWRQYLPKPVRDRIEVNTYAMKHWLAATALQIPPHSYVLDAGAGEGRFRHLFSHTKYIGVDLAVGDTSWDYSRLSAINALQELCFPDDTFDVVICTQVLEHVAEPEQVLRELTRVLKPGGHLVLVAPQSWHEHQVPYDFFRYTSFGIRYLLKKVGLSIEEIRPLGGYYWYLSFQLQLMSYWTFSRNKVLEKWGLLHLLLKVFVTIIFELLLPLLLFYLDPLDRVQEATLGHYCVARKPAHTPT